MRAGEVCSRLSAKFKRNLQVSDWDRSSFQRGRQVRAIRNAIVRTDKSMPLVANLLRSVARPGMLAETLGQASFRGRMASVKRNLHISEVAECPSRGCAFFARTIQSTSCFELAKSSVAKRSGIRQNSPRLHLSPERKFSFQTRHRATNGPRRLRLVDASSHSLPFGR